MSTAGPIGERKGEAMSPRTQVSYTQSVAAHDD